MTPEPTSQTPNPTVNRTTRSGRVVRAPERYVPVEVCEDDYGDDEYDSTDLSDVSSEASFDSEEMSSETDADEEGNLRGFVVEDNSDIDQDVSSAGESETESDDE